MKDEKEIRVIVEIKRNDKHEVVFHHDHVEGRQLLEKAGVPLHEHEELFAYRDGKFHHVRNDETIAIKNHEYFVVIPRGEIRYAVDDEPQWTAHKELTPVQIMKDAGIDPDKNYLTEIKADHKRESFKDEPTKHIHMHDGMKFITTFIGPKPVSNC
jgi:hypothetical protein